MGRDPEDFRPLGRTPDARFIKEGFKLVLGIRNSVELKQRLRKDLAIQSGKAILRDLIERPSLFIPTNAVQSFDPAAAIDRINDSVAKSQAHEPFCGAGGFGGGGQYRVEPV